MLLVSLRLSKVAFLGSYLCYFWENLHPNSGCFIKPVPNSEFCFFYFFYFLFSLILFNITSLAFLNLLLPFFGSSICGRPPHPYSIIYPLLNLYLLVQKLINRFTNIRSHLNPILLNKIYTQSLLIHIGSITCLNSKAVIDLTLLNENRPRSALLTLGDLEKAGRVPKMIVIEGH